MANCLRVPHTNSYITWRKGVTKDGEKAIDFTVKDEYDEPIAKAKITAEQLHAYICTHNTMK